MQKTQPQLSQAKKSKTQRQPASGPKARARKAIRRQASNGRSSGQHDADVGEQLFIPATAKPENVVRTIMMGMAADTSDLRDQLAAEAMEEGVTCFGVGVQSTLNLIRPQLVLTPEDSSEGPLETASLYIPIRSDKMRADARKLIEGRGRKKRKVPPKRVDNPTSKTDAINNLGRVNSYAMSEIVPFNGRECVRCEIARRVYYQPQRGTHKDKLLPYMVLLDTTKGLQGLLKTWLKPDLSSVSEPLRAGVCQQAGQQLNSHLGLLALGTIKAQYPSVAERDPTQRKAQWRDHLAALLTGYDPLEQALLRDVHPDRFAEDDPKGDRLVIVDEDWFGFIRSPFAGRFPLNFVQSDDVVLYEYAPQKRIFAAIPLFQGVPNGSKLHQLSQNPNLQWWHSRVHDFHPLPAWKQVKRGKKMYQRELEANSDLLLVPVTYRRRSAKKREDHQRFREFFADTDVRKVCWSFAVERSSRKGGRTRTRHELAMPTKRVVTPRLRPNILGIHFGDEPVLWWHLVDGQGQMITSGNFAGNEILTTALGKSLGLRQEQKKLRWVGDRRFKEELRRRTFDVARQVVSLADEFNANLALELIRWVLKSGPDSDLNRRFSLWNYSQLGERIQWQGLEWSDAVATIASMSDYVLAFTCPVCRACKNKEHKKPQKDKAATWLEQGILECRKCGFQDVVSDAFKAELVAEAGYRRYLAILERHAEGN